MSGMSATSGHSAACCNLPPIVSSGYQSKGNYEDIGGYKTYVTGPTEATKAIVIIFDIFGFFEQTLQGADILAHSGDQKYRVFIPDFFRGEPCPIAWYPPDTDEKQKNLGAFFGKNPPTSAAAALPGFVEVIKAENPSIASFGVLGFCWGGKAVALAAKESTNPFTVAASVHPAMVDAADAPGIQVPFIMLASGDEDADDVKKFDDALLVPKHVEVFADQIHGWMAARSNLSDDHVKAEYERGYHILLKFFSQHL